MGEPATQLHEPRARYLTHANSLAVFGPWPTVQRLARELGVRRLKLGRLVAIPADEFFEAFERAAIVSGGGPGLREPTKAERDQAIIKEVRRRLQEAGRNG